ncbi:VOC family protein [Aequorivita sp. SDUM287046]|uniref:VOC family protein n=1 Tax=Aequorivita aurantiaca TaxID=3053356 RepID=A0ABT8DMG4_9FLAO|nr:VOC family protein [Aequorivita aurantiaca]MDN3724237.1 VOC family protein [Aequorivita aurantiaca]
MTTEYWLNLPIKDLKRSKKFFTEIGFVFNPNRESDTMASLMVGKAPMPIMLFEQTEFERVVQSKIADTEKGAEIIISFNAETKTEVDEMAKKVKKAGGDVFTEPSDIQGWMYNVSFKDPDGHRWNMLYMDREKMPR